MVEFTWAPSHPASVDRMPKVKTARFGDGYEQRQADGLNNNLAVWNLVFSHRDSTEAAAIEAFLSARGGVERFEWTDPDGNDGAYICRKWTKSYPNGTSRTINAVFEEVAEA